VAPLISNLEKKTPKGGDCGGELREIISIDYKVPLPKN
jgi:hypothetical protein